MSGGGPVSQVAAYLLRELLPDVYPSRAALIRDWRRWATQNVSGETPTLWLSGPETTGKKRIDPERAQTLLTWQRTVNPVRVHRAFRQATSNGREILPFERRETERDQRHSAGRSRSDGGVDRRIPEHVNGRHLVAVRDDRVVWESEGDETGAQSDYHNHYIEARKAGVVKAYREGLGDSESFMVVAQDRDAPLARASPRERVIERDLPTLQAAIDAAVDYMETYPPRSGATPTDYWQHTNTLQIAVAYLLDDLVGDGYPSQDALAHDWEDWADRRDTGRSPPNVYVTAAEVAGEERVDERRAKSLIRWQHFVDPDRVARAFEQARSNRRPELAFESSSGSWQDALSPDTRGDDTDDPQPEFSEGSGEPDAEQATFGDSVDDLETPDQREARERRERAREVEERARRARERRKRTDPNQMDLDDATTSRLDEWGIESDVPDEEKRREREAAEREIERREAMRERGYEQPEGDQVDLTGDEAIPRDVAEQRRRSEQARQDPAKYAPDRDLTEGEQRVLDAIGDDSDDAGTLADDSLPDHLNGWDRDPAYARGAETAAWTGEMFVDTENSQLVEVLRLFPKSERDVVTWSLEYVHGRPAGGTAKMSKTIFFGERSSQVAARRAQRFMREVPAGVLTDPQATRDFPNASVGRADWSAADEPALQRHGNWNGTGNGGQS